MHFMNFFLVKTQLLCGAVYKLKFNLDEKHTCISLHITVTLPFMKSSHDNKE